MNQALQHSGLWVSDAAISACRKGEEQVRRSESSAGGDSSSSMMGNGLDLLLLLVIDNIYKYMFYYLYRIYFYNLI